MSENKCNHENKRGLDWFDGGYVEICKDCGMSRHLWEQGESDWIMVDFASDLNKEIKARLEAEKQPEQQEYKEYEFCKDMLCPQMLGDDCIIGDDFHLCLLSIPKFMTWLKENNYKIIKQGDN